MSLENNPKYSQLISTVRERMSMYDSGHDWWHIQRVRATAATIADELHADLIIVDIAALLHDVADWKFHGGNETAGMRVARELLNGFPIEPEHNEEIIDIIRTLSFKGAGVATPMKTLAGQIVQDADRLDALGAIGIARCFAYSGFTKRPFHDPDIAPILASTSVEYAKSGQTAINHFHEKLLLLKDRMNTEPGKRLAVARDTFMRQYLDQFHAEWEGRA